MKPILFNTEMVRAILNDRKSMTRRLIKLDLGLADTDKNDKNYLVIPDEYGDYHNAKDLAPYQPGMILWVRETWNYSPNWYYCYKADAIPEDNHGYIGSIPWRPSIHMPREAARIFLRVTNVRVERVQDITLQDIKSEGIQATGVWDCMDWRESFKELWDGLNLKRGYGWDANPWVWVYELERVSEDGSSKDK